MLEWLFDLAATKKCSTMKKKVQDRKEWGCWIMDRAHEEEGMRWK